MCWVSNGWEEVAGVTLAAPFPLTRGYEHLFSPPVQFPGRWTLVESSKHPRQSDWSEQSDARPSTGVSSPGSPVSPCTGLGVRMAWFPFGNPICVFFHGKDSLAVNPCLACDRASVRFCRQPSSLLLGRICPRVQSYVVLPQTWASPYQCLHMLSPFGQDVASVAPFSGRLASRPLRQAVTTNRKDLKLSFTEGRNPFRFRGETNSGLAISSSDVLSGPGGHQG